MDEDEHKKVEGIIGGYESDLNNEKSKNAQLQQAMASSSMYQGQDQNLIIFQLELDNILEKIEHLLRGDVIKTDGQGNLDYYTPEDEDLVLLNEYGVQLIMNIISTYLNRNTILSWYDIDRVYEIMMVLGEELADVVFCNYERMGMDTESKKSRYPLLVVSVLNIIESTYRRSLEGGERESLRTGRVVTQSDSIRPVNQLGQTTMKKSFSMMDPKTW